jgi:adenine/guanine phosphoribosyltransferase-like PRPP-binding protein
VMVTGGTLEACARALIRTGHTVIAVLVVAHSPQKHQPTVTSPGQRDYAEINTLTRRT